MSQSPETLLGVKVKVTNILDTSVQGTVYSVCAPSNTITIEQDNKDFYIVKMQYVKDIQVIERAADHGPTPGASGEALFASAKPQIGFVSIVKAKKRLAAAVQEAELAHLLQSTGASKAGQEVFAAIYKTLPCRWHGTSIIALDEVRIDPPYTVDSCVADKPNSKALAHVKGIVAAQREKMGG